MARPLSEHKRTQLILAAIECIEAQGLSASTAMIAKTAGVSSGSLFTYFDSKEALINVVYVHIMQQILDAVMTDFPQSAPFLQQLWHWWNGYIQWGILHQKPRLVAKQIALSVYISPATQQQVHAIYQTMRNIFQAEIDHAHFYADLEFSLVVMEQMAEATILQVCKQPERKNECIQLGFEMVRRAIVR